MEVYGGLFEGRKSIKNGASAEIFFTTHQYGEFKTRVILKEFLDFDPNNEKDVNAFNWEVNFHKRLNFPFIAQYFGHLQSGNRATIIMEYAGSKTLLDIVTDACTETKLRMYFIQLICAIQYLHNNQILHRDIKLENIIVDPNDQLVLIDFGICNKLDLTCRAHVGSLPYSSPEAIKNEYDLTGKSDIWSAGVVLYCLFENKFPFEVKGADNQLDEEATKEKILNGQLNFNAIRDLRIQDLILHLLEKDPKKRYSIDQILTHPWIREATQVSICQKCFFNVPELSIIPYDGVFDEQLIDSASSIFEKSKEEIKKDIVNDNYPIAVFYKINRFARVNQKILDFRRMKEIPRNEIPSVLKTPAANNSFYEVKRKKFN